MSTVTEETAGAVAPRRGRPRDARCDQAILRATLDMLVEGGAAHLSVDGVAARAGVGKATIYRRWSSKEALVLDALNSEDNSFEVAETGTLRGDLEVYFDALVDVMSTSRKSDILPHLIEAATFDPEVRVALDEYIGDRQRSLRALLQRAQRRGELAAGIDLQIMIDLLVGPVMYRRLLTGGRIDRAFVRKLLDVVL